MPHTLIDATWVYLVHELQLFGFAQTDALIEPHALDFLSAEFTSQMKSSEHRSGVRNLLDYPGIIELVSAGPLRMIAEAVLGSQCFAVRGIYFDKTPDANWKVGWHQDTTIAVSEKLPAPGYDSWSEKGGAVHVRPPVEVLQRMISLRLHLDDCSEDNGPLRVLSATHRHGILDGAELKKQVEAGEGFAVTCVAKRGSILVLKPLLLHASSPAQSPAHRRVIHIDFAADELPGGLNWRWRVKRASQIGQSTILNSTRQPD